MYSSLQTIQHLYGRLDVAELLAGEKEQGPGDCVEGGVSPCSKQVSLEEGRDGVRKYLH